MNKELTIDELKALKVGDWVWLVDLVAELGEQYVFLFDKEFYYQKETISNGFKDTDFEVKGGSVKRRIVLRYSDYGKKWLAYKNKEQAQAKGEIVELREPTIVPWEGDVSGFTIAYEKVEECFEYRKTRAEAEARLKELQKEQTSWKD